jgi:transposase
MEPAFERVRPAAEPKTRSRRKPLPEHLQREVVNHTCDGDCCPDCGGESRQFGEDVSKQLEYIPDSFNLIRHVRPRFACSGCERVVEAPAQSRPIERGLAGPGLLAYVLVSMFADHLPLYRQSENYARQGVEIERSTLAGWVGGASDLLAPLIDAIQKHVLVGAKLHTWQRQDEDRASLDLCTRRQARGRRYRTGRLVRILGGSQGRASATASEELQGWPASGRICRLPSSLRLWRDL